MKDLEVVLDSKLQIKNYYVNIDVKSSKLAGFYNSEYK